MRIMKATMAAMLAVTMTGSPVLAQAAPASMASLSLVDRAGSVTDDASELRGGFIIPLIALIAIILGIVAASGGNDSPTSP